MFSCESGRAFPSFFFVTVKRCKVVTCQILSLELVSEREAVACGYPRFLKSMTKDVSACFDDAESTESKHRLCSGRKGKLG